MLWCNSLRQTVHTHRASVHLAAKLVATLFRVARVTAGLAESNAAYRRVYDSRHLHVGCQEPGSAPEPYLGNRVRATFLHLGDQTDMVKSVPYPFYAIVSYI